MDKTDQSRHNDMSGVFHLPFRDLPLTVCFRLKPFQVDFSNDDVKRKLCVNIKQANFDLKITQSRHKNGLKNRPKNIHMNRHKNGLKNKHKNRHINRHKNGPKNRPKNRHTNRHKMDLKIDIKIDIK